MKFSKFYAPTTKEAPKDASLPSHQFLIRGGFVEQIGSGLYNYLPLGKIMHDKISRVVKEEMNEAGALEVSFSVVTSGELWKQVAATMSLARSFCALKIEKIMTLS